MSASTLYWREAGWLWLILPPLLLITFNRLRNRWRWQRLADRHLLPWIRLEQGGETRFAAVACLLIGWLLLCVALAGPRTIKSLPPQISAQKPVLLVVLDLSASMQARDVHPDRRGRATRMLARWLAERPANLDVGLLVFAGHAYSLLPSTADDAALKHFTALLDLLQLPTRGNSLADALQLARQGLQQVKGDRRLILLSDGDIEAAERERALDQFNQLAQEHVHCRLIGVGEKQSVTISDIDNRPLMFHDRPVLTRLQDDWLRELAQQPGIDYLPAEQASRLTLNDLINLSPLDADDLVGQPVQWTEWFSPVLLAATGLLALSLWLPSSGRKTLPVSALLLTLLPALLLPLLPAAGLQASQHEDQLMARARQAMQAGDYAQAKSLFSQLGSADADFGLGSACYRLRDFHCSSQAFAAAAWKFPAGEQRARSVFNLGNSYFFLGDYAQAAVLYRDAGLLGMDAERVSINLEYATSLEAALERHLQDIEETLRRARWRAAASGKPPPSVQDLLANQRNLLRPNLGGDAATLYQPPAGQIEERLLRRLGLTTGEGPASDRKWVKTGQVKARDSAWLINRLLEMETGIMAPLQQPQIVAGKRSW